MVKVRELIARSSWRCAAGFDCLAPRVTVILPTFRRGDNGLFKRCVESLLSQTYHPFELIIVDDASIDSTASLIDAFMASDDRVAVIRHERNIGLPAVSELEGYLRARASRLFFAFDDCEFKPHAIEALWTYMHSTPSAKVVYGIAQVPHGKVSIGNAPFDYRRLHKYNYIPNSPLMLDTALIEKYGFFDPHIAMTRICDWDLWRRIAQHNAFHHVAEVLSYENGPNQIDSLGNSYAMDLGLIYEWSARNRNEALRPGAILDYEVDNCPRTISAFSREKLEALRLVQYASYWWASPISAQSFGCEVDCPYVVVLCDNVDPRLQLRFSHLPPWLLERVILLEYDTIRTLNLYRLVLAANAVFVASPLHGEAIEFVRVFRTLQVPWYYLACEEPRRLSHACRKALRQACGLFSIEPAYGDAFRVSGIRKECTWLPPKLARFEVEKEPLSAARRWPQPQEELVLGIIEDSSLSTLKAYWPTLRAVAATQRLRLVLFCDESALPALSCRFLKKYQRTCERLPINLQFIPLQWRFETFLNDAKSRGIHIWLGSHDAYIKGFPPLISGHLMGALIVHGIEEITKLHSWLRDASLRSIAYETATLAYRSLLKAPSTTEEHLRHILRVHASPQHKQVELQEAWNDIGEQQKVYFLGLRIGKRVRVPSGWRYSVLGVRFLVNLPSDVRHSTRS